MLFVFVNENKDDWDDYLFYFMMVYRVIFYISIKCSLNLFMFGREIFCFLDIMVGIFFENFWKLCFLMYVKWLEIVMNNVFEFVYDNLCIVV